MRMSCPLFDESLDSITHYSSSFLNWLDDFIHHASTRWK